MLVYAQIYEMMWIETEILEAKQTYKGLARQAKLASPDSAFRALFAKESTAYVRGEIKAVKGYETCV